MPRILYRMGKTGPGLFSWWASNKPPALLKNSVSLVLYFSCFSVFIKVDKTFIGLA
jgi:hypothetical protein